MTTEQLKDLLTSMADEAAPAALHQRALAQSRRGSRNRAVLASITALVLAGVGIFGVPAQADRATEHAQAAVSALPNLEVKRLTGFYFQVVGGGAEPEALVKLPLGTKEQKKRFDAKSDRGRFYSTGRLSPYGIYFSYLTQPSTEHDSDDADQIKIRNVAGGESTVIGEYQPGDGGPCSVPEWSLDGKSLFVDRGPAFGEDERTGFIDVASGAFTPLAVKNPCDVLVTTDAEGRDLVLSSEEKDGRLEIYATDADGDRSRTAAADILEDERGAYAIDPVAASPGGRFACFATEDTPDSYVGGFQGTPYGDTIVDLVAGKVIEIPEAYGTLPTCSPSVFAIPGRLVLEASDDAGDGVHQLYDYNGNLLDESASTMGSDSLPIGFVPA